MKKDQNEQSMASYEFNQSTIDQTSLSPRNESV